MIVTLLIFSFPICKTNANPYIVRFTEDGLYDIALHLKARINNSIPIYLYWETQSLLLALDLFTTNAHMMMH
jgi:hypothetical protein